MGAHPHYPPFTGASFDTRDSAGTHGQEVDRFTADDLVAVSFLSVDTRREQRGCCSTWKPTPSPHCWAELGSNRGLVDEKDEWSDEWAGWRLWNKLMALPDVGATKVSRLYARKRPRLRFIYDSVVSEVIGSKSVWEPLPAKLQAHSELHPRLLGLRSRAELPPELLALRIFDVVAWMEGTYGRDCPWPPGAN